MGCDECDQAQKELASVSFVRVDKANVMIVGCREHLRQLLHVYNLGHNTEREEKLNDGLA